MKHKLLTSLLVVAFISAAWVMYDFASGQNKRETIPSGVGTACPLGPGQNLLRQMAAQERVNTTGGLSAEGTTGTFFPEVEARRILSEEQRDVAVFLNGYKEGGLYKKLNITKPILPAIKFGNIDGDSKYKWRTEGRRKSQIIIFDLRKHRTKEELVESYRHAIGGWYALHIGVMHDVILRKDGRGPNYNLAVMNDCFTRHCGIQPNFSVLDVGTGAGWTAILARGYTRGKVYGVDISQLAIRYAIMNAGDAGYPDIDFKVGNIFKLPFEDNSVDMVISSHVLKLIPPKLRILALMEIYRVARVGIAILEPSPDGPFSECCKAWTKSEWQANLEGSGFVNVEIKDVVYHDEDGIYLIKAQKKQAELQQHALVESSVLRPLSALDRKALGLDDANTIGPMMPDAERDPARLAFIAASSLWHSSSGPNAGANLMYILEQLSHLTTGNIEQKARRARDKCSIAIGECENLQIQIDNLWENGALVQDPAVAVQVVQALNQLIRTLKFAHHAIAKIGEDMPDIGAEDAIKLSKATGFSMDVLNFCLDRQAMAQGLYAKSVSCLNSSAYQGQTIKEQLLSMYKNRLTISGDAGAVSTLLEMSPQRLFSLINNLLANAYKYGGKGASFDLRLETDERLGQLRIQVTSRGPGIALRYFELENDMYKLFALEEKQEGWVRRVSIGMAEVLEIVKRSHGIIEIKSTPGAETVIAVSLPIHQEVEKPCELLDDIRPAALLIEGSI